MTGTGELPDGAARGAVIHSFARAVDRPCARPHCSAPASSTLTFNYATRDVWLEGLSDEARPQAYDLCATHAARTRAPNGWHLRDRRPEDERHPDVPPPTPADLGGDRTVAVLAAALRAVPDPVSEDAVADATPGVGPAVAGAARASVTAVTEPAEAARVNADTPQPRPVLAARRRAAAPSSRSAEEAQEW